jgi:hypothetical protein
LRSAIDDDAVDRHLVGDVVDDHRGVEVEDLRLRAGLALDLLGSVD